MDDLLIHLINRSFNAIKAADLFLANDLLLNYNYTTHLEHFNDLLGTEAIDNPDSRTTLIIEIFEQSIHDVLLTLFIVPRDTDFNSLFPLLTAMYQLENYLDHAVVLDEIDDVDYLKSPKDTLVHLLETLFEYDWSVLNETIREVRQTLIDRIIHTHQRQQELMVSDHSDNLLESRIKETKHFFNTHPNTITQSLVKQGVLAVPVETETSLPAIIDALYNLQDNRQIAIEILALVFVAPIHLRSIGIQTRVLINQMYADVGVVTRLNLEVDKLIKEGGLTHAQQ